jgi:hypothetical protein
MFSMMTTKPRAALPAGFGGLNTGDLIRPQVQDPWGRSPSDPAYGQPPPDGAPPLIGPGVPYDQGPMPEGPPMQAQPWAPPPMPAPSGGGWNQPMSQQGSSRTGPGLPGLRTAPQGGGGLSLAALGGALPWGGTSWLKPAVSQGFSSPLGSFIRR